MNKFSPDLIAFLEEMRGKYLHYQKNGYVHRLDPAAILRAINVCFDPGYSASTIGEVAVLKLFLDLNEHYERYLQSQEKKAVKVK